MKQSLLFLFSVTLAAIVHADPSTETLLGKSSSASEKVTTQDPTTSGLQSGRYQAKEASPDDQPVFKVKPKKKSKGKHPASEGDATPVIIPVAKPVTSSATTETQEDSEKEPVKTPTLGDQVRDVFKGGSEHSGPIYREQIHPDDVRNNKVEIDISSGMIYNNSTANIAYRNYYTFSPFAKAQAHLWLTPLVGISGGYLSTLSETVPSTTVNGTAVNAKSEWTELSVDFRKFFGMSRRSNSLNYGLFYSQYKLGVPAGETTRAGIISQGIGIYLNARIPTAPSYAWTFGGDFTPSVNHSETQTALNLQSGTSNTASRMGFSLGGELKLSRENQMFWNLGVKIEKDQFAGTANMADPYTGQTPSGVTVTNTWTYFNLGYRWGQ